MSECVWKREREKRERGRVSCKEPKRFWYWEVYGFISLCILRGIRHSIKNFVVPYRKREKEGERDWERERERKTPKVFLNKSIFNSSKRALVNVSEKSIPSKRDSISNLAWCWVDNTRFTLSASLRNFCTARLSVK